MSSFTISANTGVFYPPVDFELEHGGVLVAAQLAFGHAALGLVVDAQR